MTMKLFGAAMVIALPAAVMSATSQGSAPVQGPPAQAAPPPAPTGPPPQRPGPPARDPLTPGYVTATELPTARCRPSTSTATSSSGPPTPRRRT